MWNAFVGRVRCEPYLSRPWFREESKTQHLKILKDKNMKHPNLLLPEVILLYVQPHDAQHSVGLRLRNFPHL